jgi:hypothetical protein
VPNDLAAKSSQRTRERGPRSGWWVALAACVPLAIYLWTASGHGYWLDSAEFGAAAVWLDIPHPPGHPLFGLWSKPFTWLPVGPLPFRVALAQAVAAALALAATQRAIDRTLARFTRADAERPLASVDAAPGGARATSDSAARDESDGALARGLLALAATWTLAGAYGFWFQAVRAEVYALEAMLVCASLERLSALRLDQARPDPRPFYQACLALGLGLANHHFIAVLALPALAYALVVLLRAHGARVFGTALLAGALGLVCYLYLPLRAASEPPMDLGHPLIWRDFFWVVSAQVYARNIGTEALQPLGERFADLAVIVVENFTLAVLPLALLGGYALLRKRRTWPLAYLFVVTALVSLGGRAFLNPVRANPDVLGYMMPGFAALLALAAVGVAAVLAAVLAGLSLPARRAQLACGLLAALGLGQFAREHERSSLAHFRASDSFDELRRRALPPRSLIILTTPDVVFRHWEGEAVEQLRRDVVMLPLPFLGYGVTEQVLARRHPMLRAIIDDYNLHGVLPRERLRALAETRPVFVELDTSTAFPLTPVALPEGLLYRILPDYPSPLEIERAAERRERLHDTLATLLREDARETETHKQLLWTRYVEALYYGAHGAHGPALTALGAARALSPKARELGLLERALVAGRRDMTPFLLQRSTRAPP